MTEARQPQQSTSKDLRLSPALDTGSETSFRYFLRLAFNGISLLLLFAPPLLFPGENYWLGLFAKYMAWAILALSVDLIWGYTGLLSLGQGVFFGLGAYMVAYSLTLQRAAAETPLRPDGTRIPVGMAPPQFMQYTGPAPNDPSYVVPPALKIIAPLGDIWVALVACIALPMAAATLFGFVTFRLRIRGVYFSLVTQALLLAFFTLFRNQQRFTGGVVGIKHLVDLKLFGYTFNLWEDIQALNFLASGILVACFLFCSLLVRTKYGKILTAIRENENRVLALGYNTALYKTFIFAVAGGLAGIAGGLYVVANELCGPTYLSISFSIEAVIWVAVGGRGTLLGAILGAVLVGFGQSYVQSALPEYWLIVLGAIFVMAVLFIPKGLSPVAGPGALLGLMLGLFLVIFIDKNYITDIDKWLGLPKSGRVVVGCPLMVIMVFMPKIVSFASQKFVGRFRRGVPA